VLWFISVVFFGPLASHGGRYAQGRRMSDPRPKAAPCDYQDNPDRFKETVRIVRASSTVGDVHELVASRFVRKTSGFILDIGSGTGQLRGFLKDASRRYVALDKFAPMLATIEAGKRVQADAALLPFPDNAFGGIAALYMLYHLDDPVGALREVKRVLRPDGLFAACTVSRFNEPELFDFFPPGEPFPFSAEDSEDIMRETFPRIEVERWDGKYARFPNETSLKRLLKLKGLPDERVDEAVGKLGVPFELTKRGVLFYAKK